MRDGNPSRADKMNRVLCMCTPVLGLRSLPAASPVACIAVLCTERSVFAWCSVEAVGAEAAGCGLVVDVAVLG